MSTTQSLQDAITEAVTFEDYDHGSVGDVVLATPEMQAIRLVLDRGGEDWMRGQMLPQCVIDWVLL